MDRSVSSCGVAYGEIRRHGGTAGTAAAQGLTRWGVLHHVGRRSGAAYDTPIDAQRTPDGVVIGLVYGQSVDWCRNILAAGYCTLTLNGNDLDLTAPQVISLSEAEPLLAPERARFWRGIGIEHCVSLIVAPQVEAAPGGVLPRLFTCRHAIGWRDALVPRPVG